VFQRGKKNPMWRGRFREDFIAEDGSRKRRQRSISLGLVREIGKREALRRLSGRLAEINQGRHKPEMMISFERFVLERFEPNIYPALRASTANGYRWTIRRYLLPALGKSPLPEIGPADVQALLSALSRKIAPRTVLSVRNRLRRIFGAAKDWGYITLNPADKVQLPALCDVREKVVLTPGQVSRLLAELPEPHRTMALVAVLSGLRRGELFGLRWKSVDLGGAQFSFANRITRGSNRSRKLAPHAARCSWILLCSTPCGRFNRRCLTRTPTFFLRAGVLHSTRRMFAIACFILRAVARGFRAWAGIRFVTPTRLGRILRARASKHCRRSWATQMRG